MEADQSNPEAQQALASYSLVTGQLEEARTAMDTSLQLWLPQHLLFLGKVSQLQPPHRTPGGGQNSHGHLTTALATTAPAIPR